MGIPTIFQIQDPFDLETGLALRQLGGCPAVQGRVGTRGRCPGAAYWRSEGPKSVRKSRPHGSPTGALDRWRKGQRRVSQVWSGTAFGIVSVEIRTPEPRAGRPSFRSNRTAPRVGGRRVVARRRPHGQWRKTWSMCHSSCSLDGRSSAAGGHQSSWPCISRYSWPFWKSSWRRALACNCRVLGWTPR